MLFGVSGLLLLLLLAVLSFEQCFSFILFSSFPLLVAFVVGGLGFEFCVFVAGWRHARRSEWLLLFIIIITTGCSRGRAVASKSEL